MTTNTKAGGIWGEAATPAQVREAAAAKRRVSKQDERNAARSGLVVSGFVAAAERDAATQALAAGGLRRGVVPVAPERSVPATLTAATNKGKARTSGAPKASPAKPKAVPKARKAPKAPYRLAIGRRSASGAYGFAHQEATTVDAILAQVRAILTAETHEGGLREVLVHLGPKAGA